MKKLNDTEMKWIWMKYEK